MPIESPIYSVPWILLIVFFIMLTVTEHLLMKRQGNLTVDMQIIRWISIISLIFFFGLRGFEGWDWTLYYPAYKDLPPLLSFRAGLFTSTRFEHGFVVLMAAVKSIWSNYHFFVFISTLIDILILNEILKRYSKYSFSFSCLLFIIMGGFYLETDLLRGAKSIMLFLLSVKYIEERKILPYYLLNIAACLFHISALIFLPLYFVLNKKISRKTVIIIFIAGLTIFLLRIQYIRPFLAWISSGSDSRFAELINKYLENPSFATGYGITIGLFERIVTFTLIIIYYEKLIKKNSINLIFLNCFILYFIIFFYFSEMKIIPVRVGSLFSFSYWILFPALVEVIQNRNNKAVLVSCFFIYSLIKITGMTDNILYRYVNVLFTHDDVISRLKVFESSAGILIK